MPEYTLGLFANMYPAFEGDSNGIFIKRMADSLEKREIKLKKAVKTSNSPLLYPKFFFDSFKVQKDNECDIFQAHYIPHSSIIPALLKKDKPLILKFHGDDGRIYPYKNNIYRQITKYMIKRADHVIVVSNELKENILSLGGVPEKVSVLGSGIDTSKFKPLDKINCRKGLSLPEEKTIFLYIGRLHKWKGISEIIEVAKKKREILFLFIGIGEIPVHPENCIFLGPVKHSFIREWIGASDCLLLPSYTEGLPNVLMESLSCERPAIASDVGGCPEIIDNMRSGLLIPPGNVNELFSAVEWMESHESDRHNMGLYGRQDMIKHYEHETLIDKLVNIHKNLLEEI